MFISATFCILSFPTLLFIPHITLHSAEKCASNFCKLPLDNFTHSMFCKIPLPCHSKHTSAVNLLKLIFLYNETAFPVDCKGENWQQLSIQLMPVACCILRPVRPVWPVHGSYTGPCLLWPNGCMDQDATW